MGNFNDSNTDGLFTLADSFWSPYEILPISNKIKYLGIFSDFFILFYYEMYVVCTA